ncbi:hypothetical protein [Frondihabitans sucicola]|uniref:hypothetical protein n=1 Tax=Frondihabitans sucicola TaxID=1268041 RepID=UPI0025724E6C|nr:hypothetical protein [Frondihabitans sucicola]
MVEANFCVYPWDLASDGAGDRIAATGATAVALAGGYHAVRAATPSILLAASSRHPGPPSTPAPPPRPGRG